MYLRMIYLKYSLVRAPSFHRNRDRRESKVGSLLFFSAAGLTHTRRLPGLFLVSISLLAQSACARPRTQEMNTKKNYNENIRRTLSRIQHASEVTIIHSNNNRNLWDEISLLLRVCAHIISPRGFVMRKSERTRRLSCHCRRRRRASLLSDMHCKSKAKKRRQKRRRIKLVKKSAAACCMLCLVSRASYKTLHRRRHASLPSDEQSVVLSESAIIEIYRD